MKYNTIKNVKNLQIHKFCIFVMGVNLWTVCIL